MIPQAGRSGVVDACIVVWLTPELSTAGTLSRCSFLEGLLKPKPSDIRENIPLRGDCMLAHEQI